MILLQHGTAKEQGLNASKVWHFNCWWHRVLDLVDSTWQPM